MAPIKVCWVRSFLRLRFLGYWPLGSSSNPSILQYAITKTLTAPLAAVPTHSLVYTHVSICDGGHKNNLQYITHTPCCAKLFRQLGACECLWLSIAIEGICIHVSAMGQKEIEPSINEHIHIRDRHPTWQYSPDFCKLSPTHSGHSGVKLRVGTNQIFMLAFVWAHVWSRYRNEANSNSSYWLPSLASNKLGDVGHSKSHVSTARIIGPWPVNIN